MNCTLILVILIVSLLQGVVLLKKLAVVLMDHVTTIFVFVAILSPDVGALDLFTLSMLCLRMVVTSKRASRVLTACLCVWLQVCPVKSNYDRFIFLMSMVSCFSRDLFNWSLLMVPRP